ncbi:unnamed protein product [Sympodiomycopsis kandeliae]
MAVQQWPLEVTITPSQSSFFAGEELRCSITFTNHNVPIPASQPLPSQSRFPDANSSFANPFVEGSVRRTVSTAAHGADSSADLSQLGHSKSRSFDFRKPDLAAGSRGGTNQASHGCDDDSESVIFDPHGNPLPLRKGMIGQHASHFNVTNREQQQTSLGRADIQSQGGHAKSHSIAAIPSDIRPQAMQTSSVGIGRPSTQSSLQAVDRHAPSPGPGRDPSANWSTIPPSPSLRKPSAFIQHNHPHSRKKSVIQVQNEDLSAAFELASGSSSPHPHGVLYASNANASEMSLVSPIDTPSPQDTGLDSQSKTHTSSSENSFYNLGNNDTMDSVIRDHMTDWSKGATAPSGLNSASASPRRNTRLQSSPLFPQRSAGPPGSETILWTFAQFGGSYEIDESLIKPAEFEDVKRKLAFGDGLTSPGTPGTPRTLGGGDLGQGDSTENQNAVGWARYLRGALGSAQPSAHSRGHLRTGSTMLDSRQKTMTSKTIPLFMTPPSIIAVDLTLLPGQTKTYSYVVKLPADIPPSFFGKAIKFSYELTVGTNRIDRRNLAASVDHQRSRLIKVPLRVYNHVNISGAVPFFDLGNPIIRLKDDAKVEEERDRPDSSPRIKRQEQLLRSSQMQPEHATNIRKKQAEKARGQRALTKYTLSLLASCPQGSQSTDQDLHATLKHLKVQPDDLQADSGHSDSDYHCRGSGIASLSNVDDDGPQTCKGAVEILSRNSQKVSYDISKDGQIAAVLTLIKSRYRLGDTVLGAVTINKARASARVVRFAASLESHEVVEPTLSTMSPHRIQKMTRKVHAEHHESTLDVGHSGFSLAIPSGATPDFSTSGVRLHWTVRFSFLTQMGLRSGVKDDNTAIKSCAPHLEACSDDGYSLYHSSARAVTNLPGTRQSTSQRYDSQTKLEIVECAVPITVLPNSTSFRASAVSFKA